ncbi:MAG: hypothetical protein GYB31_12915 [Bacteroidetes bacterium]|nr:hypothetical protein [Bacteroidota bacterium]
MKKLFFSLIAMMMVAGASFAQDAGKDLRKATRALSAYHLDPTNNASKLDEAKDLIDSAIKSDEVNKDPKAWIAKGEIYNGLVQKEYNMLMQGLVVKDTAYTLPEDITDTAAEAVRSFNTGAKLAEKKSETRDAYKGLAETASYLQEFGNRYLQTNEFAKAYQPLQLVLEIHENSVAAGEDAILQTDEDVSNNKYIVAYCASVSGKADMAKKYFQELVDEGFGEPGVYAAYVNMLMREETPDNTKIEAVLDKGKNMFPGDTDLLFAEINYYLRQGRLDELTGKLQTAIEKEPDNATLYSTLGNVYDQLFQQELEAGNDEKSSEYFDQALKYYNLAVEKDPEYVEAVYSIGALYFNEAAAVSKELIELESDFSPDGIKRYESKKEEMMGLFDKALPYFKEAEAKNPNDINTLIALREIFARKDDIEKSNEFKARMERIQNGETIKNSYF